MATLAVTGPAGGLKSNETATVTVAAHAATTAYVLQIVHPHGGSEQHGFTTSGAGGATVTFTPSGPPGQYTLTSVLAVQPVVATTSVNVGGVP